MRRFAMLAAAACTSAACARLSSRMEGLGEGRVEVWLTTADSAQILSRAPDLVMRTGHLPAAALSPTIVIDGRLTFQKIAGFGAAMTDASAWLITNRMSATQRQALLGELYGRRNGLALSLARLTIGGSDFSRSHYSLDDVAPGQSDPTLAHFSIDANRSDVIPVMQQALAINPDLRVFAAPWSAPAWMKSNDSLIKGTLRRDAYAVYADYLRRYVEAYRREGIRVFALSLQNEPHFEPADYPGMRLTPEQRIELLRDHVGPLFARTERGTRLLEWDHNWDEVASPLAVLADSGARRFVSGVAWHCYGGDVAAQRSVHDAHPDKESWFTECAGGEWAPAWGDNLLWNARTLIIGTARNWARGVIYWNVALDENHGPHRGGCSDCRGVVTIDSRTGEVTRNVEYYVLAHVSRFVRPGAHRIASTSIAERSGNAGSTAVSESVEHVAFRNADDGTVVLILANSAYMPRTVSVREGDRVFAYEMPARAVATLRWH